jgi:chitinase
MQNAPQTSLFRSNVERQGSSLRSKSALLSLGLLLFPGVSLVQAQAPNVTYQGPLVITQGGTYSGNFRSTSSNTPVITIQTTQPVIIQNCILTGPGDLIDAKNGGADLIVRNNSGYGATQTADNTRHGRFIEVNSGKSVRIENNYFEHTTGIDIYQWGGPGALTIRYNKAKNIDGRYRNGGGQYCNFVGINGAYNINSAEVAWNEVVNEPNQSLVEDNINLYNSGGTSSSHFKLHDNYVQGAYPYPATGSSYTGSGITLDGDAMTANTATAFVDGYSNQLVSTCAAMNIASGHDNHFYTNRMVTSGLLPDGSKMPAGYAAAGLWNAYQQPGSVFFSNDFSNNTIGFYYQGGNVPYNNRQDTSPGACNPCTNTTHLPDRPLTVADEQNEWTIWQQKLSQNGITLGAGGSAPTTPTTPANTAPTVSLTAPATATVGTAISLTATAADANGTVTKVEFFNGATKLGEDLTSPYALSYTPTAAGTLSLTARATDNAAATTTSAAKSVTVSSTTTPTTPTTPTSPAGTPANATFVRALNMGGAATTIDGRSWEAGSTAANFQINGGEFANQAVTLNPATDAARADMIRSSVYSSDIAATISNVTNGTYFVYAYVWEDNNAETFSVSVEGQTVQSNYNSGSAGHWDRLGPFTANVTDGTINLNTTGGDANLSGIEIWKQNTTTTPANVAPTVSLTAPTTGTVGTALSLTATAADADGTVTKVEFFNGATKLGEDLTSPYALSYTPTAAGTLSLTARATDNTGAITNTAAKSVTVAAAPVSNTAPTVSLTAPATATVGTAISLTATAADANGTVTKVEFFNGATKLGEDLTSPYALSYTPTAIGTLSITARATDNAGAITNTAATTVTVKAATTPTAPGTPANATFFRAVNVNGAASTIDGRSWEASSRATNFRITGSAFANQAVTLNPATDATRASMIRSSVYGTSVNATISNVTNGTYIVYLYVWEDNSAESFNVNVEGQTVQSNYNSGSAGHWDRLGPFTANVADGTINVGTSGGHANVSGIEIWKQNSVVAARTATTSTITNASATFSAYPNAFSSELNVQVAATQTEQMEVALFNASGSPVRRQAFTFSPATSVQTLQTSNLPTGAYTLKFMSGSLQGKSINLIKK